MLSIARQTVLRSSKHGSVAFKHLTPKTNFGMQSRIIAPFSIPHAHAFSTAREEELEAENKKLREELEILKKKEKKKGIIAMIQENGLPFVVWWATLYAGCGVGIYYSLEAGYIGGGDAIHLIQSLGIDQYYDTSKLNPTYGNIAVAVLLNELLEAVRFPLCIATTPYIKRAYQNATGKKQTTQ